MYRSVLEEMGPARRWRVELEHEDTPQGAMGAARLGQEALVSATGATRQRIALPSADSRPRLRDE